MAYDIYPATDAFNNFPPVVRQALAESDEITTVIDNAIAAAVTAAVAAALVSVNNELAYIKANSPILCKWIIGTGWRTLSGAAIPTDGLRVLHYKSQNHDPASVTVSSPTFYNPLDEWLAYPVTEA